MKFDQDLFNLWCDLKKLLWQDELNPRVRFAFGNVFQENWRSPLSTWDTGIFASDFVNEFYLSWYMNSMSSTSGHIWDTKLIWNISLNDNRLCQNDAPVMLSERSNTRLPKSFSPLTAAENIQIMHWEYKFCMRCQI